jgi:hypothetical protein
MTDDELKAIEARANAATSHDRITYVCYEHGGGRAYVDGEAGARHLVMDSYEQADREFDFATRTDIPALVAEVRRLRGILDGILGPLKDATVETYGGPDFIRGLGLK